MTAPRPSPLLAIDGLSIAFRGERGEGQEIVRDFRVQLSAGEIVALIGESGSGKTMLARSIPRLLPAAASAAGSITLRGVDMLAAPEKTVRAMRGRDIGFVFQEPLVALNPAMRIGEQLDETLRLDRRLTAAARQERIVGMLERLRVPRPRTCLGQFPHEFSGGMRQRIVIANAMIRHPALLIADEPSTALDALLQGEVLRLMLELARESGSAVLLITHDLSVVAEVAERLLVMEKGDTVERGTAREVLQSPRHPYTQKLLAALPRPAPAERPDRRQAVLVSVSDARVTFAGRDDFRRAPHPAFDAVKGVSLEICRGETVAIVGESGSGKTTLARAMMALAPLSGGRIAFAGADVARARGATLAALRRRMQFIFQDPFSSLDPRMRVVDAVAEGLHGLRPGSRERRKRALAMLARVGIDMAQARRFPHELSGGQRQRVCIARALVLEPEFVVADEPVSALDPSVQAQVLKLLRDLQRDRGFTLLFISHDLAVVGEIAERILVMRAGHPLESGSTAQIFNRPLHPYTRELLQASAYLQADGGEHRYVLRHWRPAETLPALPAEPFSTDADESTPRHLVEVEPGHLVAVGARADAATSRRNGFQKQTKHV